MTLIAIACKGDRAEFVTDSLTYKANLGSLSTTTKFTVFHHIDTAVMCNGDGVFGNEAKSLLRHVTSYEGTADLDGLVETAPEVLRNLWAAVTEAAGGRELYASTVFFVGYSASAGEFRAFELATETGFKPVAIESMHLSPTPWRYKPSTNEATRLMAEMGDSEVEANLDRLTTWTTAGPPPVPATTDEWAGLAQESRIDRALGDVGKILVGGSLYYTELSRGMTVTAKLGDFDDTGQALLDLVGYSQHPAAQERPCWCDSGKRHIDCHLAPFLDKPCGCGQPGKAFRECCATERRPVA